MSSTSVSPVPSATPSVCNSQVSFQPPEGNISRPYCAFNWPTPINDLQDCCNDGAEVLVFNNCTQYCEHSGSQRSWIDCVIGKEPAADLNVNQFPCFADQSATSSEVSTVSVTTSVQTGSQSATSSASSSAPTTSDALESEGKNQEQVILRDWG